MTTNDDLRKQYEAKLLVLKEKRKMHMLTQDQYDVAQRELATEIYGPDKKEQPT
jgi:hypothetical protein